MEIAALVVLWCACGFAGGHLLSYPGDGLNARHFLGAFVGPVALFMAALERARPT